MFKNRIKTTHAEHAGFTLIETLFAVLIFSSALIALMTIAGRGISATSDAEQSTTASYLAQEGIEVVRNIRDTNYGNNVTPWDSGFSTCTQTAPCMVNYDRTGIIIPPILATCTASSNMIGSGTTSPTCPAVNESPSNGEYTDGTANPSQYFRTIYVVQTATTPVNEYEVVSRVNWVSKTIPHVVELDTILKDWH